MPHEDKNYDGSLVLDFRKRWRHMKTIYISKPHESGRMRVSPLYVDVILGPSKVRSEINFVH